MASLEEAFGETLAIPRIPKEKASGKGRSKSAASTAATSTTTTTTSSSSSMSSGEMDIPDGRPRYVICPGVGVLYCSGDGVVDAVSAPKEFQVERFEVPVRLAEPGCFMIPNSIGPLQLEALRRETLEQPVNPQLRIFTMGSLKVNSEYFAVLVVATNQLEARLEFVKFLEEMQFHVEGIEDLAFNALPMHESSVNVLLNKQRETSLVSSKNVSRGLNRRKRTSDYDFQSKCTVEARGEAHASSGNKRRRFLADPEFE